MRTKVILSTLLLGAAVCASAQNMYDAKNFSTTQYYGSARTVGMGNAVTAVGGDIGTITFNPAGSAVAGYSQISVTPDISISSNFATGSIRTIGATSPEGFQDGNITRNTRMGIPSFGAVLNIDTHRSSGLVSYAFGIASTMTNNFLNEVYASGTNNNTTYLGYLATQANGIPASELDKASAYDSYPWLPVTAYQARLISTYGDYTDQYVGATEYIDGDNIGLAGEIGQRFGQLIYGNKYDIAFNWAGNINDVVYIGANIGITSLTYRYDDYMYEQAIRSADFPIEFKEGDTRITRYFEDAKARYSYTADGAGIYAQLGVLARLPGGFRLGAMIQSPTRITMKERWSQDMSINYNDVSSSAESDPGSFSYRLRTPWKLSAGLAWTLGESLLLSADYEMMSYKNMRFISNMRTSDQFVDANGDIAQWMGVSHTVRVGAEYRPIPQLAIRAGYNFISDPEKDEHGKYLTGLNRHNISAGLGYSSNGSFFADLALRMHARGKQFILPYGDYIDGVASPEIALTKNRLWDVLVTVGWRF